MRTKLPLFFYCCGTFLLAAYLFSACSYDDSSLEAGEYSAKNKDKNLPNWATPEELASIPKYVKQRSRGAAPHSGFRVPAEYEPLQAVLMTWTSYRTILQQIAESVASTGAKVWMVGGPTSLPNVPNSLYQPLNFDYDTVWVRDYGPIGINEKENQLGLVDTTYRHYQYRLADDAIPCEVAQANGAKCYSSDLILDGGNFMTDGQGNLFFTKRLYEWNSSKSEQQVDQLLRDYFGVTTLHRFDYAQNSSHTPADGTGHIDMFAKLLDDCKVLVAQTDQDPYHAPLEAAATYFANLNCPNGGKYQVYRIPGWSKGRTWYTYTNALAVNKKILMPSYSGADNELAKNIYQAALPDYEIIPINSDASITSGGSIHCITQNVPTISTLPINHPPVSNAGTDQTVIEGVEVQLDGTGSTDADNDTLTFNWTQIAGPAVILNDSQAAQPTFIAPAVNNATTLTFALVVNDGKLDSEQSTVNILVNQKSQEKQSEVTVNSSDTPLPIPDADPQGITSTIQLDAPGVVNTLQVEVHIKHNYVGDLKVELICPDGQIVTLHDHIGGSSKNITQSYSIHECTGQPAAGAWKLHVLDDDYSISGNLEGWSLIVGLDE